MTPALAEYEWRNPAWFPPQQPAVFADSKTEPVSIVRPIVSPPSTASVPKWAEPVAHRLVQLSEMGRNWDGRGSAAVRRDALVFALQILWQTMPPTASAPSIIPLGHGGIQLIWTKAGVEIEVEVVQPNEVIIYHFDRQSEADSETRTETEFTRLADLLRTHFA